MNFHGQGVGGEFVRLESKPVVVHRGGELIGLSMMDTDEIEGSHYVLGDLRELRREIERDGNRVAVEMFDFLRLGIADFFVN